MDVTLPRRIVLIASLLLGWAAPARAQDVGERDVIARVLERNPSYRASLADRRAIRSALRGAEGDRTATFTASATGGYTERITNTAAGVAGTTEERIAFATGLAYTTSWGLGVTFDIEGGVGWRAVNRDPSTTMIFQIGPSYDTTATLGLRQPLLRGAGEDAVMGPVREAEANRRSADATAENELSQLLSDALSAHWELWYASRAFEVQEQALALGTRQVRDAELRAGELGTIARTEVLRLASDLAQVRRTHASAETTVATSAITVGRLLGYGSDETSALRALRELPLLEDPPSLASLVEGARQRSPELVALDADVEAARVALATARDAAEVRLDLTGELAAGVLFTNTTIDTFQLPNGRPAIIATVGLELEVPLGPSGASGDADVADAQLEAAQARLEVRAREIEAEIATLRAELLRGLRDVTLAEEAANAAHELAEAERQSFELGLSEAFTVVEAQQNERTAALSHLRAVADYATAAIELMHRTGNLLEQYGVTLPEAR